MENLIDLQASILLNKFGAGDHKPGSGSAVALQGMLAAQMIKTVIDITLNKKSYQAVHDDLMYISREIEHKIYPALDSILQQDSIQFGRAIEARNARDNASNIELKSTLAAEALNELRTATELPISVAKYCIRLTEIGLFIFDKGFQSARGDSSVAINGALSAVSGCISIINLNLLSFQSDDWTIKMREEADNIRESRDLLLIQENECQTLLQEESDINHKFHLELKNLTDKFLGNQRISNFELEKLTNDILNCLWQYRHSIWKKKPPQSPKDIIDPIKILKKIGYQFQELDHIESYLSSDGNFDVAGIIDTSKKHVTVSTQYEPKTINFTLAHELGHAVLHPNSTLHRDRPLDGSNLLAVSDYREIQANRFAVYFLMPAKQIINTFIIRFKTKKFEINTETALRLGVRITELRENCKTLRDLSRLVASLEFYNNKHFTSLSDEFNVSTEAMAIRLEELSLVKL